ncbi:MAG: nucleotidyltransferase family protein [Acidobacteriaceae bacterium]|nr:nucleotidyltransferase family protein [Acidobacteriaceae bacterium]
MSAQDSIRATMEVIDRYAMGIAIVVDANGCILATVTDGDIRRAILAGTNLDGPVSHLRRPGQEKPVVADISTSEGKLLALMERYSVRQVPLLDENGRVLGLAVQQEILRQHELPVTGVIMAGGYGKRLLPLTESVPKPMLPVNGRPLLEHTLSQLRQSGIRSVNVATHHLSESIMEHFKDGSEFGVQLQYFHETEPLGTAGGLAKMTAGTDPLLIINGDVLTTVDVRAMLDFHREHRASLTVGVRQYDIEVPFGVIETEGVRVTGIQEKPVLRHFINAGIYMADRDVCRLVPDGRRFDMPDLIAAVIEAGGGVISFPVREYWIDIGRIEQYHKAELDLAAGML